MYMSKFIKHTKGLDAYSGYLSGMMRQLTESNPY